MYFVGVWDSYEGPGDRYHAPQLDAFDAITLLGPHDYLVGARTSISSGLTQRLRQLAPTQLKALLKTQKWAAPKGPRRVPFREVVAQAYHDMPQGERYLPSVLAGWDNTPRSSRRGLVYEDFTAELFGAHLEKAVIRVQDHPKETQIVFLKAWNEWAEGNILEPDAIFGHALIDKTRDVIFQGR